MIVGVRDKRRGPATVLLGLALCTTAATSCTDQDDRSGATAVDSASSTAEPPLQPASALSQSTAAAPSRTTTSFPGAAGTTRASLSASPAAEPVSRVMLSLRDNGSTVAVRRSSRITLSLPSGYRWSTPSFTGARATASEVVFDAPNGGQEFDVVAHETGRSTLRSTGRPTCASGPSCPAADLSYEVVLDVRS